MATTFLEPGGDADFAITDVRGFWKGGVGGTPTIATDHVHGSHIKSINIPLGTASIITSATGIFSDAGSRVSIYFYMVTKPQFPIQIFEIEDSGAFGAILEVAITSAGVLILRDGPTEVQIGSNGATLSTGVWYRISLAYTLTSTTVNRLELFINGVSTISITNATLTATGTTQFSFLNSDSLFDFRVSDLYVDNSSSLTDTGDIWVTAKRPKANGTTNGFTTQIGAGGSGYGTGHSPQVNERPLSNTNGWSMIGAGSAVTEEYNIENKSTGDIDISTATIVDWLGWVDTKALVGETVQIILDGVNNAQAITSTETLYTKIKGSTTYPSGGGADIGMTTDTSLTTVSLYECGIIVAYIPSSLTPTTFTNPKLKALQLLGVGT